MLHDIFISYNCRNLAALAKVLYRSDAGYLVYDCLFAASLRGI